MLENVEQRFPVLVGSSSIPLQQFQFSEQMKYVFRVVYQSYLILSTLWLMIQFSLNPLPVSWFAAIIGHLIPLGWFFFLSKGRLANAGFMTLLVYAGSGTAFLISFANVKIDGPENNSYYFALAALIGWLIYDKWYLALPGVQSPDRGSKVDINLVRSTGEAIQPTANQRPFVLFITPGLKDPFGRYYLRQLDEFAWQATERGIEMYPICGDFESSKPIETYQGKAAYISTTKHGKMAENRPGIVVCNEQGEVLGSHFPRDFRKFGGIEWALRFFPS